MSDVMRPQPFPVLLKWILTELEENQSVFGIHRSLFYTPRADAPYSTKMFGHHLATPIGPAAGPHTQLAHNIVCAWLCGGRFIELKTVQIMDELEIPRPCIDMEDEGYNVEWSQELKLDQSASEYVKAWALIHILRHVLEWESQVPFGTVFNMSVGYDLEGIKSPPMTRFVARLRDASEEIAAIRATLKSDYARFAEIDIPPHITDNVTLSTMHGCPPDEMERICLYLLEEQGLHTTIKLNPTLLGKQMVMSILHDRLGFREIHIPDSVFEHDLQYDRAVELIRTLRAAAAAKGVVFGIKLSNTLAMSNHKGNLPGDEMYMSGRALYPITINLFHKLSQQFGGDLNVSYSAGADAINVAGLLASGAKPITTVSDLLKPGGYANLVQYLEELERVMNARGVSDLDELARDRLSTLELEAAGALEAKRYKKEYHPHGLPKVTSGLDLFDCVTAPCSARCAVAQDVSEYAWLISQGEYSRALEVILSRNPFPNVTGYVCTHLCQTACTRNNYDQPVAIRALKRYAAEKGQVTVNAAPQGSHRAAVIGSGPSGLAAAYFLALNGVQVTVFEAKDRPGGMLSIAPTFRLPEAVVREDIERIAGVGVQIELSHAITGPPEELLEQGFDAVFIGSGAQKGVSLGIEGESGSGVYQALPFLEKVRRGEEVSLGSRVLVIGGGNSAMDAARTARRLTGAQVTVVYRRTRREMPATDEEVKGLLDEGIELVELASPLRFVLDDGKVAALECIRNELGEPGPDGRRRPTPVSGSEFELEADSVVIAIGQRPDVTFMEGSAVSLNKNSTVAVDSMTGMAERENVFAGGDAVRGPAIIIEACADGRRAAEAICQGLGIDFARPAVDLPSLTEREVTQIKRQRARKVAQNRAPLLPPEQRQGFDLVEPTLVEQAAADEASRCLQCSTVCDKCVEVCPNRANYALLITPINVTLPRVSLAGGSVETVGEDALHIEQSRQIVHVDDLCNECGNCATFCVHEGSPYRDKPRLFLSRSEYEAETDNAFFIESGSEGWTIYRREAGAETSLCLPEPGRLRFTSEMLEFSMSTDDFQVVELATRRDSETEISLVGAIEMYVILQGVLTSLPFLPLQRSV